MAKRKMRAKNAKHFRINMPNGKTTQMNAMVPTYIHEKLNAIMDAKNKGLTRYDEKLTRSELVTQMLEFALNSI